jgi:N-acetylmuramoyl-L-alanine amidase
MSRASSFLLPLAAFALVACSSASAVETVVVDNTAVTTTEASSVQLVEVIRPAKVMKERPLVVLDPGHGGDEVGSASNGVVEKHPNLDMAFRVEQVLIAQGFDVVLTRREDVRAAEQVAGYTATRSDLQARLDLANAADADVFVSIHSNGSSDPGQRGLEVWYDGSRSFAEANLRLAFLLKQHVLAELYNYGYAAIDRGLFDGQCFRFRNERCISLFVLGGARETSRSEVERRGGDPAALGFDGDAPVYSRPGEMPGALIELLIITNASDNAVLRDEAGRQAMARGIATAIAEFLRPPEGG